MSTPAVQKFCVELWDARDEQRLGTAAVISRGLAVAVAQDVEAVTNYDPYEDRRVEWVMAVVKARTWLKPHYRPAAEEPLEDLAAYLLGRQAAPVKCGKDYAAGEGREA